MCMSFVAVGRSLTIVSYVAFKMVALWFWTMFNCNPPIAHCHPLLWGGGILVDHWSTISSCACICRRNWPWAGHDTFWIAMALKECNPCDCLVINKCYGSFIFIKVCLYIFCGYRLMVCDNILQVLWQPQGLTHWGPNRKAGPYLNIKTIFPDVGIHITKRRWPSDCLIIIIRMYLLVRQHLYVEMRPGCLKYIANVISCKKIFLFNFKIY